MTMMETAFQLLALALGLALGSFLNVCIARMPEDRSVVRPPSHCPACGAGIRWFDNIPVFSWLLLRARCRACQSPISATYPLVEATTGILVLLVWRQVFPDLAHLDGPHLAAFAWYTVFVSMLVGLTFIDAVHYIIPDEFSIHAVPLGVGGAFLIGLWQPGLVPTWQASVVGALAGGGALLLVTGLHYLVRREVGMGMGDVKLLAMIGSFLGPWPDLLLVMMVAAISGSVVGIVAAVRSGGGIRTAIPFGPFIALGGLVSYYFGDTLVRLIMPGLLLSG